MTWAEFIPVFILALVVAIVLGALLGSALARRGSGVITADRTPTRPPATPRLVPIGGCRECGAPIGAGHRDHCPMRHAGPGPTPFVTEGDCRHLTAGDMGMG